MVKAILKRQKLSASVESTLTCEHYDDETKQFLTQMFNMGHKYMLMVFHLRR